MNALRLLSPLLVLMLSGCQPDSGSTSSPDSRLQERVIAALDGEHRSTESRTRDDARKPAETLAFWGLQPDMTVVEVWPGGGWYTEILAPVLRDEGTLIAAGFPDEPTPAWRAAMVRQYQEKLAAHPQVYDRVHVVPFDPPSLTQLAEPGSADMVILSRHFHNFIRNDIVDDVLNAARDALRPGGILAVVQHRAQPDAIPEKEKRTGYVREQWLIDTVEAAGFTLDASSPLHHNPRDSRDHEDGVWALAPSLRSCQGLDGPQRDTCVSTFSLIGESDRMTLRFIRQ